MTDIKRAAWLGVAQGEHGYAFAINDPDGQEFWRKQGAKVAAVVEVQPVMDALMKAQSADHGAEEEFNSDEIWEIIAQLEKALQP